MFNVIKKQPFSSSKVQCFFHFDIFTQLNLLYVSVVPPVKDLRQKNEELNNLISNDMMTVGGRKKFLNGQTEVSIWFLEMSKNTLEM